MENILNIYVNEDDSVQKKLDKRAVKLQRKYYKRRKFNEKYVKYKSGFQKFLSKLGFFFGIVFWTGFIFFTGKKGFQIIDPILKENNQNYKIVNLKTKMPKELANMVTKEGFVRILPYYADVFGGADGFFISCLKKE